MVKWDRSYYSRTYEKNPASKPWKTEHLETLKDSSNTSLSLKFLEQRVHELVGGGVMTPPPQTTLWGEKGLDREGLNQEMTNKGKNALIVKVKFY